MKFLLNLRQRKIGQWALAYLAGAWLAAKVVNGDYLLPGHVPI